MSKRAGRMNRGGRTPFKFRDENTMNRKASDNDLVDIAGEIKGESPLAYRFYDGAVTEWVPKSQVEWDADDKVLTLPYWLALEKGFI